MSTQTFVGTLEVLACGECGTTFGMTPALLQHFKDTHKIFYCPSGHRRYFPDKSDTEKLQEQLERQQAVTRQAEADATRALQALQAAKRSLSATQGVVTKIKKRVYKGTCPQCRRHFQNLERHMQHVHPGYCGEASHD